MSPDLLPFVGVSLAVIATPGQDTVLTVRNTLGAGRDAGLFTALGVATGQLTWALATSAGLAALLLTSEPAFRALRLAGAAYLVYLGARSLFTAMRPRERATGHAGAARRVRPFVAYRQGLVSNLGNAKMAVFFTSLLPQFVPSGSASFWLLLALGSLFALMTLAWLSGYAAATARLSGMFMRRGVRRTLDAVTGAALVAFGVRLAVAER